MKQTTDNEKKGIQIPLNNYVFDLTGYQPKTTFWQDFSIADMYGNEAIEDTYRRAKSEWQDDCEYFTELCMVLNHKIWQWYEKDNQRAALYDRLWKEADALTINWGKEEQEYYYRVTD